MIWVEWGTLAVAGASAVVGVLGWWSTHRRFSVVEGQRQIMDAVGFLEASADAKRRLGLQMLEGLRDAKWVGPEHKQVITQALLDEAMRVSKEAS